MVVGAGIGGLAAAIELAAAGFSVTLCEAASTVGGKADQVCVADRVIATGPTVLTMKWVFDLLLERAGAELTEVVRLQPLDCLARHTWSGGATLDLFADRARSRDAIGRFAGSKDAAGYSRFMARGERTYLTLRDSFLANSKPNPLTLARRAGARRTLAIRPFTTLWRALEEEFTDPRLRQLYGRYATYCGASPYRAPATLGLIAYVEQAGVFQVAGGLPALARALADVAVSLGCDLRLNTSVREITVTGRGVSGVRLADERTLPADAVVANCDVSAFASGLLGRGVDHAAAAVARHERSLSAITWALVADLAGPPLEHHNVFFSDDYHREFADLFERRRPPRLPTVYLCDPAHRQRRGADPAALFGLINAPASADDGAPTTRETLAGYDANALATLRRCGLTLRPIACRRLTPMDYAARYPGSGGALYGRASHGWRASFKRQGNRSRVAGLYLAGGTVHPGPGVPMAALSGIQAARNLVHDVCC